MEECLTALYNCVAAQHCAQPIRGKVYSEDRWCCCLQHCPGTHCRNQNAAALVTCHHVGVIHSGGKSPPRRRVLPQLPREYSPQKDTKVSECATENPAKTSLGRAQDSSSSDDAKSDRQTHWTWHKDTKPHTHAPPHANTVCKWEVS